jgi:tetratricopeptide (TPR) repeat protein
MFNSFNTPLRPAPIIEEQGDIFMKKSWLLVMGLTVSILVWKGFAAGPSASPNAPRYTADKKLLRPTNYREWVYLSSGLGMNYGPAAGSMQMFTNVFVAPEAYREFMATGKWPDKTVFALEVYSPASHGSINKSGHYQDTLMALEAEVKDSSTPEVWRYYGFGTNRTEASALPKQACFDCHEKSAAVEHSFVQFYPQLLDVAFKKGVIKPGVDVPLNLKRFSDMIVEKGWQPAEQAYMAEKQKNPDTALADEHNLSMLASSLAEQNKGAEAISVLELSAREHPASASAFNDLADGYAFLKQKDRAIEATNKALALAEKDVHLSSAQKDQLQSDAKKRLEELNK